MRKKGIFLLGLCFFQSIYSITMINFSKQLVVIYKVLNPLTVTVDTPEKMVVKAGNQSFKYSDSVASKKKIGIKVEAPYYKRDEILDLVYATATLKMQDNGNFYLTSADGTKIKGRGYFPSVGEKAVIQTLPLYTTTVNGKYEARTEVDAVFNEDNSEMKLGEYSGVLKIDVTYGE
ncbi:hypothetical protein [Cetobacterium sp.]